MKNKLNSLFILAFMFFSLCQPISSQSIKQSKVEDVIAKKHFDKLTKAEKRITELGMLYIRNPQIDSDYRKNDSITVLSTSTIEDYISLISDAYGHINTDSIFIRLNNYRGYIPQSILDKIQPKDWETKIGKVLRKQHIDFVNQYKQFDDIIGNSICNENIILKAENNKDTTFCSIFGDGIYLVDIWASWCGSCRSFNKKYKSSYKLFKSKGIETIGISIDKNEKAYLLAKQKDNVPWKDYCDPSGELLNKLFKNKKVSLPFQFLVDKKKIVKILPAGLTENQLLEYLASKKKI